MSTPFRLTLAVLAVALLGGCSKSGDPLAPATGPGAIDSDDAAVRAELARHPELVDDDATESEEQTAIDATAPDGGLAPIRPLFFWRRINHVERSFEIAFANTDSTGRPTTAIITVHKILSGTFNIVAQDPTTDNDMGEGKLVRKPLRDHWVRRILLKRFDLGTSNRRAWRIVASSGVKMTSRGADTRIVSLRVQAGDLDSTLTDPLAFFRLRRILRFEPGAEVALTITTLTNDDVVVLYSHGNRFRFANNGDNTYTGKWRVPRLDAVRHVGVNALSHDTLYDDEAPYDSQAWILPYIVRPTELADFAP